VLLTMDPSVGISTESGGTGNPHHSPKYVGAPRNDIKVSQG
jgi:hypothetical protein